MAKRKAMSREKAEAFVVESLALMAKHGLPGRPSKARQAQFVAEVLLSFLGSRRVEQEVVLSAKSSPVFRWVNR